MASRLSDLLQELQVSNGLDLAAVVSSDGLVIDAAAAHGVDAEAICSVAANGLLMMDAFGQELCEKRAELVTLEFPGHIAMMAPLEEEYLLTVVSGPDMNLGRIRIVLRKKLEEIAQAVEYA